MSAALVAWLGTEQNLMDDLESTLYVLLWMGIMYFLCRDKEAVSAFINHCLNPIVSPDSSHTGKIDFVMSRKFFSIIRFPNHNCFPTLIDNLGSLFVACYRSMVQCRPEQELAVQEDPSTYYALIQVVTKDPKNILLQNLLHNNPIHKDFQSMEKLQSLAYIIELFTTLVNDDSKWTNDPPPSVQDIWPPVNHSPFTKSSWVTVQWMDDLHNLQLLAPADCMSAGNGDIICTPDNLEDPLEDSDLEILTYLSPASVVEQLE